VGECPLSPSANAWLAGAWYPETGALSRRVHLWAYEGFEQRFGGLRVAKHMVH